MALFERSIKSEKLGRRNRVCIWVPDSGRDKYPVVYFQHGLGDDEKTAWQRSKLARYASEYQLIIVTPNAEASWFCNDPRTNTLWEDYFAFELPEYIEAEFPAAASARSRGQCGFSMGGYGAMMLTFLHPDRFCAVSTHSGSFVFGHEYRKDRPERADLMTAAAPPGGRYDLFAITDNFPDFLNNIPAIRFDIGKDDYLIEQDRRFHAYLEDKQIKHTYVENNGTHQWSYVDQQLQTSLDFFNSKLVV